jgi:hypothetical protein
MSCRCKYVCGLPECMAVREVRGTVRAGTYLSESVVMATSKSTGDAGLSDCHRHRQSTVRSAVSRACVRVVMFNNCSAVGRFVQQT